MPKIVRYFSEDKFFSSVADNYYFMPSLAMMSDELEGVKTHPDYVELIKGFSYWKEIGEKLEEENLKVKKLRSSFYISSWSKLDAAKECYALWKIYSGGKPAFSIHGEDNKILEFIRRENEEIRSLIDIAEIEYIADNVLFIKPGLQKFKYYTYEKEVRLMVPFENVLRYPDDKRTEMLKKYFLEKYLKLKLNWKEGFKNGDVFEGITLSPFNKKEDDDRLRKKLDDLFPGVLIRKSMIHELVEY
ncbi:MAG: hypothetical protein K2P81_00540 [Bacteriovoracaceae bacterium]|nr:hypothetical protein [Bacteriovoracaceae bacterium]